jgi:hypothetical protein
MSYVLIPLIKNNEYVCFSFMSGFFFLFTYGYQSIILHSSDNIDQAIKR